MSNIVVISNGDNTPRVTVDQGDVFAVAFATRTETMGAPAVTLSEDDSRLANSGEIRSFGAAAVMVSGDGVQVENDRDAAEPFLPPPPPPGGGPGVNIRPGQFLGEVRLLPDGALEAVFAPAGPLIRSDTTAIQVSGQDADIFNSGVIRGDVTGVDFVNGGVSSGVLENTGVITSLSRAVNIGGTGVTLINDGVIETTGDPRNGVVYTDVTSDDFIIFNNGDITSRPGGVGDAVSIELGENVAGLLFNTRSGLIQGRGEASGVWIYSPVGGPSTFTALIDNAGAIIAESTTGVDAAIRIDGGVNFVGEIRNHGGAVIEGVRNAVVFGDGDHSGAVIINEEDGLITAVSRAIDINGFGLTVKNYGLIETTGDARNGVIYATATASGYRIENGESGVIESDISRNSDAISLEIGDAAEGSIYNAGLIGGTGEPVGNGQASGVRLFSANPAGGSRFTGEIVNEGEIVAQGNAGLAAAILVQDGVGFHGSIKNSGDIIGGRNGVYIGDGEHALTLLNEVDGFIASRSRAVNIDGTGVSLINHGQIAGFGDSRNGVVYADVTADQFSILNTGSIDAGMDINGRAFNGDAISLQLGVVVHASITNTGAIDGRGVAALSGEASGVRLFSGVEGRSLFVGDIVNEGAIRSETAAAILIQERVQVRGEIVNDGLLSGGLALDASASDFALTFRQTGGVSEGGLRFGGGADDVRIEGGRVFDLIDLGDGRNRFDASGAEGGVDVRGGRDRDRIIGGAGDDRLDGGGGLDVVAGGEGRDTFVFSSALFGDGRRDFLQITDFDRAEDMFEADLSQLASFSAIGDNLILRFEGDGDTVIFRDVDNPLALLGDLLVA